MYFLFLSLFAFYTLQLVHSFGTLQLLDRPNYKFCLSSSDTIVIRHIEQLNDCFSMSIDVHKHNNNLVVNFKNRKDVCNYLCIDKCGQVYHESVFYTEDCLLTTSALENIETLSVHRGNYSDFFAADEYYLIALSMQPGDSVERQHTFISLKYTHVTDMEICKLILEPSKSTRPCYTTNDRHDNNKYILRKHYRDYSFWGKLLIFLGITNYVVPTNATYLSYLEYNSQ
ncbi:fibroblast growth factor 1 [Erinnyis ello granulovirus]|uniref:Fibroblast growth factor 1 n=1 Tax=Erinnyis ello granulovirus TaxID=307444 RepID=A0A097DAQ0_9BBAC|nr:fibroblast growth factor 1 [Erinnyis ello granulovirus]AIS92067.1 fibroblast growth factor 1 [Erinnyis ello granulovirus]ARX71407.1 fibroblast growth factor 1 [Erinnyis ello granulovirus]ARX71537.1 fibroblast growth factor 1 [Erinnyis ello granulovirus]ARX71667.1 fibroblast growth factor 1 [Erinnyis ello granulovirus]ARX71797.1 fibroblast growth factor 1 [Erinnyis ello granulovirus]